MRTGEEGFAALQDTLIANRHSAEEIGALIGAGSLGYLSLEGARQFAPDRKVCLACFGGGYPTETPKHGEKARFEGKVKG